MTLLAKNKNEINNILNIIGTKAEYIPSMSEHLDYCAFLKRNNLGNFDCGIEREKKETQILHKLIHKNYELNGDVCAVYIPN